MSTGMGKMVYGFVVADEGLVVKSYSDDLLACHSSLSRRVLKTDGQGCH